MQPIFSLDFPFAYGRPLAKGIFRRIPEDFQVDEHLGYQPDGIGEHVYLQIRKRGENTAWVAQQIAQLAKTNLNDIGYAGRKDRHAVTTQWFSVYLPKGGEPDWQALNTESVSVLNVSRHLHKLRRGEHQLNHFVIRLRDLPVAQQEMLEQRLNLVLQQGVPNYFGEQRFGRGGNNLQQAQQLLVDGKSIRDKQQRGLVLSAARSYLFNQVLAMRVQEACWSQVLDGDVSAEPSGPLWGRGRALVSDKTLGFEQSVLAPWSDWCNALEHVGLQQERRSLTLIPQQLSWLWISHQGLCDLQMSFALGAGEFATSVLREVVILVSSGEEQAVNF